MGYPTTEGMRRGDRVTVKFVERPEPFEADIVDVSSEWTLSVQELGTSFGLLCGVSTIVEHKPVGR